MSEAKFAAMLVMTTLLLPSIGALADPGDVITGAGVIEYQYIEGGFYGIISDDGQHFLPTNLPDEFKANGTHVTYELVESENQESIFMWGTLVTVQSMELEQQSCTSCDSYWWAYATTIIVLAGFVVFKMAGRKKAAGDRPEEEHDKEKEQ